MSTTNLIQTFRVNAKDAPAGVFLAALDIAFLYKDDSLPISIWLCPVIGGIPDPSRIIYKSKVTLFPDQITTVTGTGSSLPDFTNPSTYNRITFPRLIYLEDGEYGIVFSTASNKYLLFTAKFDEPILGTNPGRMVSKALDVGRLFKPHSLGAITPYPNEALMFRLERASFDTVNTGTVTFNNLAPQANANIDAFLISSNDIFLGRGKLNYSYNYTFQSNGAFSQISSPIKMNRNDMPSNKGVLSTSNGSFQVTTTMTTPTEMISPILDPTRLNIVAIENIVNNDNRNETNQSGGNALARYITRKVNIPNNLTATDIQVFLTANKQPGSNVQVYYKTLSNEDSDQNFDNKPWNLMNLDPNMNQLYSKDNKDFKEYRYVTANGVASYTTGNGVFYSTFRTWAIKIVLLSNNTAIPPIIKSFRGVAYA